MSKKIRSAKNLNVGDKVVLTERGEKVCENYLTYCFNKNNILFGIIQYVDVISINVHFVDYKGFVKFRLWSTILTNGILNFAFYEQ